MNQTFRDVELFFNERQKFGIKLGHERTNALLNRVGHPEKSLHAIHVAGTNGKGSTIQYMKSGLIASGYRVGVFTSPSFTGLTGHLIINNMSISKKDFVTFFNELFPFIVELDNKKMHPTVFEIITVLAFMYFKQNTDIVLIETGMGGKDDTTNCIDPLLTVITNISFDHCDYLVKTIKEITEHKAGIMKQNRPLVTGKLYPESHELIEEKAQLKTIPRFHYGKEYHAIQKEHTWIWSYKGREIIFRLDNKALYQVENISVALMGLVLIENEGFELQWSSVQKMIAKTKLPGRFEVVNDEPRVILDSAHNEEGIRSFINTVKTAYPSSEKHILFAAFKDKDVTTMLRLLEGEFSSITLTTFAHERALTKDELFDLATPAMNIIEDWQHWVQHILLQKETETTYYITGSLHFIMLVRQICNQFNRLQ